MERFIEFVFDKILIPITVVITLFTIFVIIPLVIYGEILQQKSPTFELYKNEWVCTETASKKTNVMVGKIMTTKYVDVCVNYKYEYKEN